MSAATTAVVLIVIIVVVIIVIGHHSSLLHTRIPRYDSFAKSTHSLLLTSVGGDMTSADWTAYVDEFFDFYTQVRSRGDRAGVTVSAQACERVHVAFVNRACPVRVACVARGGPAVACARGPCPMARVPWPVSRGPCPVARTLWPVCPFTPAPSIVFPNRDRP